MKVVQECLGSRVPCKSTALGTPDLAPCFIPRSSCFLHLFSSCKFSLCMPETNSWARSLVRVISKQYLSVQLFSSFCLQNIRKMLLNVSVRRGSISSTLDTSTSSLTCSLEGPSPCTWISSVVFNQGAWLKSIFPFEQHVIASVTKATHSFLLRGTLTQCNPMSKSIPKKSLKKFSVRWALSGRNYSTFLSITESTGGESL